MECLAIIIFHAAFSIIPTLYQRDKVSIILKLLSCSCWHFGRMFLFQNVYLVYLPALIEV